jgi:O-antigen ligase
MTLNFKNYVLPLFTVFWLFLLFFIGNSFLSYYFFLSFLIITFFFWKDLDFSLFSSIKKYSFAWIILLFFSGISFIWTKNIPYSIDYYIYFLFSFYVFHFFFLVKKSFFNFELFFKLLSFAGLILIIFSSLFTYFSDFGKKLPQMSLLYSSSGHTHLAVLSLFVIPMLFFYFLKNKDKKYLFLMGIYGLFGFLSMGRIISIIIVLQHLVIFLLYKKKKYLLGSIKKYFYSYYGFFLLSLVFMVLSWTIIFNQCSFENNSLESIKACRHESGVSRVEYWKNSKKVFEENPLKGVGLGNYPFFSKKYIENRSAFSSHPHNYFLKMFIELGVFGGLLFSFIFLGLLLEGFKKSSLKNTFLGISLLGVFTNSFLDYDWNFEGVFMLTLIFMSSFLSEKKQGKDNRFLKRFFYLVFSICFSFFVFYSVVDALVFMGNEKLAFKIFPASKWHSILYVKNDQLDLNDKKYLYSLNKNNILTLQALSTSNIDKNLKENVLVQTNNLHPWGGFYLSMNYLNDSVFSLKEKEELINQMVSFLEYRKNEYGEVIKNEEIKLFIEKIFFIADEFYRTDDYQSAGELYVLTRKLDEWSLDYNKPAFLYKDLDQNSFIFFANFENIEAQYLGQYELHYKKFAKLSIDLNRYSSDHDPGLVKKVEEIIKYWNE